MEATIHPIVLWAGFVLLLWVVERSILSLLRTRSELRITEASARITGDIRWEQEQSSFQIAQTKSLYELEIGRATAMAKIEDREKPSNLTVAEAYRIFGEAKTYRERAERAEPWIQQVIEDLATLEGHWEEAGLADPSFADRLQSVLNRIESGRSILRAAN